MSRRRQHGAALTEFVVVMLFFTPIVIGMPLIAKYSDIKSKTIEASRYAAWERTVWSDYSAARNDGPREAFKSDDQIREEIDRRFFGNPVQGVHDQTASVNYLWRNRHGEFMLSADTDDNPIMTPRRTSLSMRYDNPTDMLPDGAQAAARAVDAFAISFNEHDVLHRDVISAGDSGIYQEAEGSEFMASVSGGMQCNPAGINRANGLNLGARGFVTADVIVLANDFMHGDDPVRMAFEARSAILGDAWSAPDENIFSQRVDNMSLGDMAGCVTVLGRGIGALTSFGSGNFLFGEGMRSNPVENFNSSGSANSRVLPRYVER